jgi:hypothetical protein
MALWIHVVRREAPANSIEGLIESVSDGKIKAKARTSSELDRRLAGFQDGRTVEAAAARKQEDVEPTRALSRTDIQTVMRQVQGKASACRERAFESGTADIKLDVAPEGSVVSVSLAGKYAGTPTGTCIERAVKAAAFPPSAGLRFDYRLLVR